MVSYNIRSYAKGDDNQNKYANDDRVKVNNNQSRSRSIEQCVTHMRRNSDSSQSDSC